jgi:hypothetical protein
VQLPAVLGRDEVEKREESPAALVVGVDRQRANPATYEVVNASFNLSPERARQTIASLRDMSRGQTRELGWTGHVATIRGDRLSTVRPAM